MKQMFFCRKCNRKCLPGQRRRAEISKEYEKHLTSVLDSYFWPTYIICINEV